MQKAQQTVGSDGQEMKMNATVSTAASARSTALMQALFVALLGCTILFVAGFAQSGTLHDAAHDLRHSTGFPCH